MRIPKKLTVEEIEEIAVNKYGYSRGYLWNESFVAGYRECEKQKNKEIRKLKKQHNDILIYLGRVL